MMLWLKLAVHFSPSPFQANLRVICPLAEKYWHSYDTPTFSITELWTCIMFEKGECIMNLLPWISCWKTDIFTAKTSSPPALTIIVIGSSSRKANNWKNVGFQLFEIRLTEEKIEAYWNNSVKENGIFSFSAVFITLLQTTGF